MPPGTSLMYRVRNLPRSWPRSPSPIVLYSIIDRNNNNEVFQLRRMLDKLLSKKYIGMTGERVI